MDYIKRFTTREGVRMSLAVTTDTVETARVRQMCIRDRIIPLPNLAVVILSHL